MAEARSYAMRNRQGSDWFGHQDDGAAAKASPQPTSPAPKTPAKNGVEPTGAARTQLIKPTTNSNQWYKYDQKNDAGSSETPQKAKAPQQTPGDWYGHGSPKSAEKVDSTARVVTSEGELYCRRDKSGTSANWFSHDHAGEAGSPGGATRVTTEGSNNASRMRGQSENWFCHDGKRNDAAQAPAHSSKGRGMRTQSNEMHHIFHMDNSGN